MWECMCLKPNFLPAMLQSTLQLAPRSVFHSGACIAASAIDQDAVLQIPEYAADDCHEDLHCFLPSFPICRRLPPFKADRRKIDDGPSCPKYARTHPLLTPGAFTIFCAHGLCLGFSLMASQEGPRTPFEILFTRFKEGEVMSSAGRCFWHIHNSLEYSNRISMCSAAPSMVVYDNACNLQRYVMKRAPHFFRHTAFRIDRLHVYAHKG